MATAYTNPYEYSGGIPLDKGSIDVMGQVNTMKQNKYDANYNAIQQTIDQYTQASNGLMRDVDRKYASERLSMLVNNVNSAENRDWSAGTIPSEISHYVGQVLDNNVMNAISSTKKYQNFKTNLDELKAKKPELYSQQNEAYATQDLQRYMSSGQAGDVLSIGEYSPYTDYKKTIMDNAEKFQKMGYSVQWDPVKNAPGFTTMNKTEFLDEGKARQLISMALGEKDAQQMRIDSWYNGKNMSDEDVNSAFSAYTNEKVEQVDDQINYLNTLAAGKTKEQKAGITSQIESLNKLKEGMTTPVEGRDTKLFQMHYNNFVDNTAGALSYKRITDFKIDDSQFQFDKFQFDQQKHADSMAMEQQKFILDTKKAEADMRSKGIDPETGAYDPKIMAEYSGMTSYEQPIPVSEQSVPTMVAAANNAVEKDVNMDIVISQALKDPKHEFWNATGLAPTQFTGTEASKVSNIKGHLNQDNFEFSVDASPAIVNAIEGYKDGMQDRKELGALSTNIIAGGTKVLAAELASGRTGDFSGLKTWVNNDGQIVTTSSAMARRIYGNKVLTSFKEGDKVEDFLQTNLGKSALINILAAKKEQAQSNDEKEAINYSINQITKTFTKADGKTRLDNKSIARAQVEMKEVGPGGGILPSFANDDYEDIGDGSRIVMGAGFLPTQRHTINALDEAVSSSHTTSAILGKKHQLNTRMVFQMPITTGKDGNEGVAQGAFAQIKAVEGSFNNNLGDVELDTKNGHNIEVYSEGKENGKQMVSFRVPIVSTDKDKAISQVIRTGRISIDQAPAFLVAGIGNKSSDYYNPASPQWKDKSYFGGLPDKEKANEIKIKSNFTVAPLSKDETILRTKAMFSLQGFTSPVYQQQIEQIVNDKYTIMVKKNTAAMDPSAAYIEVRDGKGALVDDSTPVDPKTSAIEQLALDPLIKYDLIQKAITFKLKQLNTSALTNARQ